MFCPQCKAEYRRGFTHCVDCDVDLVYELDPSGPMARATSDDFRVIWRGIDQTSCVNVCYQLRDQGIAYKVDETPGPVGPSMRVIRRYELSVSSRDYESAKSALGIEEDLPASLSEAEWQAISEPGKPEEAPALEVSEQEEPLESEDVAHGTSSGNEQLLRDAYFRLWYPEDAIVKIWSQGDGDDISGGIEMALKEHYVHCRIDEDGGRKSVLVLPDDETRAREILREIVEDASRNGFSFCPLCRAEYRPGFTRCGECKVDLVATLSDPSAARARLWKGSKQDELDGILAALDSKQIPWHHKEIVHPVRMNILGMLIGPPSTFEYEVWVFRRDLEKAKAAMEGTGPEA
jgi:hypothetical protein